MGLENCLDSDIKVSNVKGIGSRMKRGIIGGILLGASALSLTGCLSTYGKAVARDLIYTGATQGVISTVQNSIEGPRGTTVNVGGDNSPQGSSWESLRVWKYKDFNNDGKLDSTENLGPINDNDVINLDKVGIAIYFSTSYGDKQNYILVDSDYNRLAVIKRPSKSREMYASGSSASNSFMKVLSNLDAGDYTLYANLGEDTNFSKTKKFTVVRDSPTESITNTPN